MEEKISEQDKKSEQDKENIEKMKERIKMLEDKRDELGCLIKDMGREIDKLKDVKLEYEELKRKISREKMQRKNKEK